MIGTTNIIIKKSGVEKVNLTLKTDQASHDVLIGKSFTLSYGTYSKTYTWEGLAVTFEVPAYVEYTISFSDVSGYTTPASIAYTAQDGNSRTLNVVYAIKPETLTVKVSGLSSGFTVSVINASTGATIGSQTSANKTYTIPVGTKYYVKASSVSGYDKPANSSTYTAVGNGTRTVTMTYKVAHAGTTSPTNGVWIQDTDGYFHTESEWDGSYTPNGVAVITSNCRFVIALEDAYSSVCWSISNEIIDGVTVTSSSSEASVDYDGESQTDTILAKLDSDAAAAYYCRAYTFPNGQKGYLGAAGEWQTYLDNYAAVASALRKCGGTTISGYRWTSTQCGVYYAWYMHSANKRLQYYSKPIVDPSVRAFCSI